VGKYKKGWKRGTGRLETIGAIPTVRSFLERQVGLKTYGKGNGSKNRCRNLGKGSKQGQKRKMSRNRQLCHTREGWGGNQSLRTGCGKEERGKVKEKEVQSQSQVRFRKRTTENKGTGVVKNRRKHGRVNDDGIFGKQPLVPSQRPEGTNVLIRNV